MRHARGHFGRLRGDRRRGVVGRELQHAEQLEIPSVLDHGRYLELFRGLQLTSDDTAAAIAAQPAEVSPRVTHALLMLRKNDPAAAKATFDDVTVFFDQMMPTQQVVVAAFTAGTGDMTMARMMRGVIQTNILTAGEIAVLDQWVPDGGEEAAR